MKINPFGKLRVHAEQNRSIKNLKEKILYLGAIGVSLLFLFFFLTATWIGYEVKNLCQTAKLNYDGECVAALTSQLEDENRSFHERNDAIWALGQLGDSRALPVLQKLYTGNIPQREPYDGVISQYELKKAVSLTSGGTNITAFLWRGFFQNK